MNIIQNWVQFYMEKRLWVYPYNLDEKAWLYWKNLKSQTEYEQASQTWDWNNSTGIKLVVGKKGVRVVEVTNKQLLKKALNLLGLPEDYPWIIYSQSKYGIIVDTPNVSSKVKGIGNRGYKQVLLLWEGYYVLPSSGIPVYFYKNRIPTGHSKQIADDTLLNCVEVLVKESTG